MNNKPDFSFVVAARNDNYGGDFLYRFQNFINIYVELCKEYSLDSELIVVEWNPPSEKQKLLYAIKWPRIKGRIISVPKDVHSQIDNSDKMPMFEYLAKNVGIRRASGKYIVATNPDILFSRELFQYLSSDKLSEDCYYRANRYDVKHNIPAALPADRQLLLSHDLAFRVNLPDGTLPLTDGYRSIPSLSSDSENRVHTNAAGDFFLMSADKWHRLRGYPELKSHSFIDGYICFMARALGLEQVIIGGPIYHQEHDRSEHAKRPFTDYERYEKDCRKMLEEEKPAVLNGDDWGLLNFRLEVTEVVPDKLSNLSQQPVKIEDYLVTDSETGKIVFHNGIRKVWIDVGAHEGETTLPYLDDNKDLAIIAFEPILEKYNHLNSRHSRLFAIPSAVGPEKGIADFYVTSNHVSSSLRPFNENGLAEWRDKSGLDVVEKRVVPVMRLDELLERLSFSEVEFVKIDAQGHDLDVVMSAGHEIQKIKKLQLEVTVTSEQIYEGASDKNKVISEMLSKGFGLVKIESQNDGQEENLTFINMKRHDAFRESMDSICGEVIPDHRPFTPAKAYWNQRFKLQSLHDRIINLSDAVDHKGDLLTTQWAQLMASALEFKPDLILELGRGRGNSTCAYTEVANNLRQEGLECRVVSLCVSNDWENLTQHRVLDVVEEDWFNNLHILNGNILTFDYNALFKGVKRCLLFWDAHGFDVAECVLGSILPKISSLPNLVIMHDLSDARYIPRENSLYNGQRLWRGNNWEGPRVRLGNIDSAVEQSVAVVDFVSRNGIAFDSADHSFDREIVRVKEKYEEMQKVLGNDLFSPGGHWFWFTLNDSSEPITFPRFDINVTNSFHEIKISDSFKILGVSFVKAVKKKPHLKDIIKRINNYLTKGNISLAVKMIQTELGNYDEAGFVLLRLREIISSQVDSGNQLVSDHN